MLYKPPGLTAALGLHFFSMKASMCTQKLKYCHQIKNLSFVNLMFRASALNLRGGGEGFPPLHFQPGSLSACHVLSESPVHDLVTTLAWRLHSRYHTSRSRGTTHRWVVAGFPLAAWLQRCRRRSQQARCSRCSHAEDKQTQQLRKQQHSWRETLASHCMRWEQTCVITTANSGSRKWLQLAFRGWQWTMMSNWSIKSV